MKRCRQCLVVARHEFADLARERSFSSWLAHSKAFRALRVLLSCVAKKVSKEGHPVGPPSTLRAAGSQSGGAFPEATSLYRPETSRIVRDALRVFAPPACRASTGFEIKVSSRSGPRPRWRGRQAIAAVQSTSRRVAELCIPHSSKAITSSACWAVTGGAVLSRMAARSSR